MASPDTPPEVPDFVAVGHVTVDLTLAAPSTSPGARDVTRTFGGTAAFAARTARALGLRAAVVTSAAADYPIDAVLPGVPVHLIPSQWTTTFRNSYEPHGRRQVLVARAGDIGRDDIPREWRRAPMALIGPLARELPADAASWFSGGLVGATVQGWLRSWDEAGRISLIEGPPDGLVPGYDMLVGSGDEISRSSAVAWRPFTEVLAITEGARGARMLHGGRWRRVRAPRVPEVDPTGAGDVWAAAYLVSLHESGDRMAAGRFATCAASLSVSAPGLEGVPDRSAVEAVLARRLR